MQESKVHDLLTDLKQTRNASKGHHAPAWKKKHKLLTPSQTETDGWTVRRDHYMLFASFFEWGGHKT